MAECRGRRRPLHDQHDRRHLRPRQARPGRRRRHGAMTSQLTLMTSPPRVGYPECPTHEDHSGRSFRWTQSVLVGDSRAPTALPSFLRRTATVSVAGPRFRSTRSTLPISGYTRAAARSFSRTSKPGASAATSPTRRTMSRTRGRVRANGSLRPSIRSSNRSSLLGPRLCRRPPAQVRRSSPDSVFEALREADAVDRMVVVAPRLTIVDQWSENLYRDRHLELKPFEELEREGQVGVVTTYQSLNAKSVGVHRLNRRDRTLLVLDEAPTISATPIRSNGRVRSPSWRVQSIRSTCTSPGF